MNVFRKKELQKNFFLQGQNEKLPALARQGKSHSKPALAVCDRYISSALASIVFC